MFYEKYGSLRAEMKA